LSTKVFESRPQKTIAMVAHDNKKPQLLSWAERWHNRLRTRNIYATGTTGKLLEQTLDLDVHCLQSGPFGGDQQMGALITEGQIDYLIFFWDPLTSQAHDNDVKALLRLAVLYNVPTACNISSADFIIGSNYWDLYSPTTNNIQLPLPSARHDNLFRPREYSDP
jgi:methylglyoxal synthase